jgi:DNA-binding HxlR family transcriptional regulator
LVRVNTSQAFTMATQLAPRAAAAYPPDVMSDKCPSRQVLNLVADKWSALIIYALERRGTSRYSELHRTIQGVSQKMLTQTLRALERDGLVSRTVHPVVPPMVEYALTPLGVSLVPPLAALCQWAESNMAEVERSRTVFDTASAK